MKNTTTNDGNFLPLGATPVVVLDLQATQDDTKGDHTWTLLNGNTKIPSNGRTVDIPKWYIVQEFPKDRYHRIQA